MCASEVFYFVSSSLMSSILAVILWYAQAHEPKQVGSRARKALLRSVGVDEALHQVDVHVNRGELLVHVLCLARAPLRNIAADEQTYRVSIQLYSKKGLQKMKQGRQKRINRLDNQPDGKEESDAFT